MLRRNKAIVNNSKQPRTNNKEEIVKIVEEFHRELNREEDKKDGFELRTVENAESKDIPGITTEEAAK